VAQIAGFANLAGSKVHGAQIAGFTSLAKEVDGLQISGFSNLTQQITGAQLAGFINLSRAFNGLQLAGFANATGDMTGLQTAGFANIAHDVTGSQVSGFINIAHIITGVQLGVVNISDTCSGLPIGVISIARNGYHKFELSGDEFTYVGFSFKSGIKHFYTILNAGYRPFETDAPYWSYGAGIGSLFGGNNKYQYNIEILSRQVFKGTTCDFDNSLHTLFLGIDRKLFDDMSLNVGLTCNLLVLDKNSSHYNSNFKDIAPYTLVDYEVRHHQVQSWIGGRLAFRF
jgi:hypothetical protein